MSDIFKIHALFRHPLYPLLVMLLKKCDEATQSIEVPSLESIDSEVRMYFQQQSEDWSPMLSDSDETNDLVRLFLHAGIFCYHVLYFTDDDGYSNPAFSLDRIEKGPRIM